MAIKYELLASDTRLQVLEKIGSEAAKYDKGSTDVSSGAEENEDNMVPDQDKNKKFTKENFMLITGVSRDNHS